MFVLVKRGLYCGYPILWAKKPDSVRKRRMTTHISYAVQFDTAEKAYYMKKRLNKSGAEWSVFEIDPSAWMGIRYSIEGNTKGGV